MPILVEDAGPTPLPPLAGASDLSLRGIDVTNVELVDAMLAAASSLVREAAASPILQTTSTVALWSHYGDEWLDLPGKPVQSVASVAIGGLAYTDYKLVDGRLWRAAGWHGWTGSPTETVVTLTHGLPAVPEHIKHLVADLAILGIKAAKEGAQDPRVVIEQIDDYKVTFADGADLVASAMTLPPATRRALRARFGGGARVVSYR